MLTIQKIIEIYQQAHLITEENVTLLYDDSRDIVCDLCVARMNCLAHAKELLFSLEANPDIPNVLKEYFDAENNSACSECWITSKISNRHPECQQKIDNWFRTRDVLLQFKFSKDIE